MQAACLLPLSSTHIPLLDAKYKRSFQSIKVRRLWCLGEGGRCGVSDEVWEAATALYKTRTSTSAPSRSFR